MKENPQKPISRKDQIIQAGFELVRNGGTWTLSEISNSLGISKTALYRHFHSKAEIEEEMHNHFVEELLIALKDGGTTPANLRAKAIEFFRANNGFLFLFMRNLFSNPDYQQTFFTELIERSPKLAAWNKHLVELKGDRRIRTEITLIKNITSLMIASVNVPRMTQIQKNLLEMLAEGLPNSAIPQPSRIAELDSSCQISLENLGEPNRFFEAIAGSIREYGMDGTTIQRIAERMGTAKSSLYFYYNNKEEMLRELLRSETGTIRTLCSGYLPAGKNFPEQIYLFMRVQTEYLLIKPDVLPVFNWIRYEIIRTKSTHPENDSDTEKILDLFKWNDFFGDTPQGKSMALAAIKWASVLATTIIVQQSRTESAPDIETVRNMNRIMFESMMTGDKYFTED